ncbi:MAG: hypothetical protein FJW31_13990 [Acidobacteria bacterium]|nr:hypothetical protein [Acidobacteriota bacterium]
MAVAVVVYAPFLNLPLLSDDYLQLHLAQRFIPVSGWWELAQDPLYRSRATSLILSYLTLLAVGFSPVAMNATGVLLHVANVRLFYGLRHSPLVGRRVAALGAVVFAARERHHEAVIWYAALPELLVIGFALGAVGQWILWLRSRSGAFDRRWWASFLLFVGALLSKESAVAIVPLLAVFAWPYRHAGVAWRKAGLPFAAVAAVDVALIFSGAGGNQHFQDGTFSPGFAALITLVNSAARGLWIWGTLSLVALLALARHQRRVRWLVAASAAWVVFTLLPYGFVSYMPRIPSRHHYFASVGFSLMIAAALLALTRLDRLRVLAPALAVVFALHNTGYLWLVKRQAFRERAEPFEVLVDRAALDRPGPLRVSCFPVSLDEARRALFFRVSAPVEIVDAAPGEPADASFCETR